MSYGFTPHSKESIFDTHKTLYAIHCYIQAATDLKPAFQEHLHTVYELEL